MAGIQIEPSPNKLVLKPAEDRDELIPSVQAAGLAIVKLLPHTPLQGVGCNYYFRLAEGEDLAAKLNMDLESLKKSYADAGLPELKSAEIKQRFEYQNGWIDVTPRSEGDFVLNFHQTVKNADQAIQAISKFAELRQQAEGLARQLVAKM